MRWDTSLLSIKRLKAAKVGDTITLEKKLPNNLEQPPKRCTALKVQPQVFAGLYPTEANQYDALRIARKIAAQRRIFALRARSFSGTGLWFPLRLLGLLHMEIVQERLEREFDQDLITTAPSVVYQVVKGDGEVAMVENPSKMPDQERIQEVREPIVTVHLFMPQDYVSSPL